MQFEIVGTKNFALGSEIQKDYVFAKPIMWQQHTIHFKRATKTTIAYRNRKSLVWFEEFWASIHQIHRVQSMSKP
jgi:hypothetical protein